MAKSKIMLPLKLCRGNIKKKWIIWRSAKSSGKPYDEMKNMSIRQQTEYWQPCLMLKSKNLKQKTSLL